MAQEDKGQFTGDFQSLTQFYDRDDRIGANTTQYLYEKVSTEAWLFLNYKYKGFDMQARYDLFLHSPLLNPQTAYTNQGIGFWSISKSFDNVKITAGYFYDQFGSGQIFRAFEDRIIGLDYAVAGARVIWNVNPDLTIKAFAGQQKGFLNLSTNEDTRFKYSKQPISGINAEQRLYIGEELSIDLGASVVNRTLDKETVNELVAEINALPLDQRFMPVFNVFLANGYFNANYKGFKAGFEYNVKTQEAIRNPFGLALMNEAGNTYNASLGYSRKGFGISGQYRHIKTFPFRTSPNTILLNGTINYLPALTRQNTYRLLARYNPFTQELGEDAIQAEMIWTQSKKNTFNANFSYVQSAGKELLFRELYFDITRKISKTFKYMLGIQSIFYNQNVFEFNPAAPNVKTITPFGEVTYRFTPKKSLRFEAQYLSSEQDLGSFVNGLAEFNISPHWSFSVGDMVNINPVRTPGTPQEVISDEIIHYYSVFVGYNEKTTRVTASYLKQVQGVNCTGGVCRVEPAFSGVKIGLTTTF